MKENQERVSNDRKPQGEAAVSQPPTNSSARENVQHKAGDKKRRKLERLSHAAGQRK